MPSRQGPDDSREAVRVEGGGAAAQGGGRPAEQTNSRVGGSCYVRVVDPDAITPWELVGAIMRLHHVLEARLDRALSGCGLSFAQYEVLEILIEEPNLHAGELGRRLRITRQSAHGLLYQLSRADLVDLLPKDGNLRCAWVTPEGRKRLRLCRGALESIGHGLATLPPRTNRDLIDALSAVDAALVPRPTPWWLD